jgi:chromosomal replication initiator protein
MPVDNKNMAVDNNQLWNSVLVEIELAVSRATFSTWFKDTSILKQENGIIYLGVPNEFVKTWLVEKYHKTILKSLRDRSVGIRTIEYVVVRNDVKKPEINIRNEKKSAVHSELPLEDYCISKEDNLNPRYTFDSFIIGAFNELAYAAAQAIIKNPGIAYNPLFVYGNTGYGKTHLIQAIGNSLKTSNQSQKIYYLTSEKFFTDYINAIQTNKINIFKEKYRKYDTFIMDDIQFLAKKDRTQEELFHVFNSLYDNNKQIIFSSDKHPNYLPDMAARLKSRFGAGMIVEITQPDHESRVAILKSKANRADIALPDATIDYLATSIDGNIRELEGILNTIICQSQLKNRQLSLVEIKHLIKDSAKPQKSISVKEIIKIISSFYDVSEDSIYEKSRRKEVVKPRQIIMYILREDFGISYPTIGQKLGGRDHTTVIHSCEKIKNEINEDSNLVKEIEQIRSMLK